MYPKYTVAMRLSPAITNPTIAATLKPLPPFPLPLADDVVAAVADDAAAELADDGVEALADDGTVVPEAVSAAPTFS